jgi:hypothetical protein
LIAFITTILVSSSRFLDVDDLVRGKVLWKMTS